MNPRQQAHFRKVLEALKVELSQDIDRTVHAMQDDATVFADPNDSRQPRIRHRSRAAQPRPRAQAASRSRRNDRPPSTKDDYGYCENCGIEIGLKRLRGPAYRDIVLSTARRSTS